MALLPKLPTTVNVLGNEEEKTDELIQTLPSVVPAPSPELPEEVDIPVDVNPPIEEAPLEETTFDPLENVVDDTIVPFTKPEYSDEDISFIDNLLMDTQPEETEYPDFLQEAFRRAEIDKDREDYFFNRNLEETILATAKRDAVESDKDTRIGLALLEGVKSSVNQIGDFAEFALNTEFDPIFELRDDLTKTEEIWKTGGEIAFFLGTMAVGGAVAGATKVAQGTYAALRTAGVGQKTARVMAASAKWLPVELGVSQLLLSPEDDRLIDLLLDKTGAPEDLRKQIKNDPLNEEGHNRLRNLAKDAADTTIAASILAGTGGILKIIGRGFKRSRANALKNNKDFNVNKEMTGQGSSNRSQVSALEDYLLEEGYTIEEIVENIRRPYESGVPVKELAAKVNTTVEEMTARAKTDRDASKRILGRHLMEDVQGLRPEIAIQSARDLSKIESKTSGRTLLDDMNDAMTAKQTDDILAKAGISSEVQAAKNGWVSDTLGLEKSSLSSWWDLHVQPTLGFDSFKGLKNLGKNVYGVDITAKGLLKAKEKGIDGIASSSGALSEDLISTTSTRLTQVFSKGDVYQPTISAAYDDITERALVLADQESFGNILSRNELTATEAQDLLDYMTAKSIEISSKRKPHFMVNTEQYREWLAKGEGRSAQFYNALEDMRKFLTIGLKYEYHHGLKSAQDVRNILSSDLDEFGKSWYFPKETVSDVPKAVKTNTKAGKLATTKKGIRGLEGNIGTELKSAQERLFNLQARSIQAAETNKIKQKLYQEVTTLQQSTVASRKALGEEIAVKVNSSQWKKDVEFKKHLKDNLEQALKEGTTDNIDPKILEQFGKNPDSVTMEDLVRAYGSIKPAKVGDAFYDVVFHDGKPTVWKIKDPALKQAVEALGPQKVLELGKTGEWLLGKTAALTKFKASLITKTPAFVIPAQLREMISSSLFSTQSNIPGKTYLTGLLKGGQALQEAMNGGFSISNTRYKAAADHLFRAAEAGGTIKERTLATMMGEQANYLMKGARAYNDIVNRLEVSAKLGEIVGAVEKGMTPREAAFLGNQLMNFSRKSASAKVNLIADHMLFAKPSMIGISKMGEAIIGNPKTAATFIGGYVATDMALDRVNSLYPESKSLPEWSTLLNTMVPNLQDWNRWPELVDAAIKGDPSLAPPLDKKLPFFVIFGAHEVATTAKLTKDFAYLAAEAFSGEQTTNDTISKAVGRFLEGTFGVYGTVPDILVPFYSIGITGKDNLGRQIVPEGFSTFGDVSTQYNENTRPLAVGFSELLESYGMSAQPNNIDFLLNWALPGVGEYALNVGDALVDETQITREGGRSKTANPVEYLWDSLKARITVGYGELAQAKTTIYQLQSNLREIQQSLEVQAERDPRDVYHEEIANRLIKVSDGNEALMEQVFPVVAATTEQLKLYNRAKVKLLNRTDEFSGYTDQQVQEELTTMDKVTEEIARNAIQYLSKYDLAGAADLLGDVLLRGY